MLSCSLSFSKYSESSQRLCEVTAAIPILQVGKVSLREGPQLEQSPTVRRWLSWGLNPGSLQTPFSIH